MTTTLPPFSGDRPTCAKCGGHEARTNWTPEQRLCGCRTPAGIGERMCRDCKRCGYHWDEAIAVPPEVEVSPYLASLILADTVNCLARNGYRIEVAGGQARAVTVVADDPELVDCRRCGETDHCACWHEACCTCGSKDHAGCGTHPNVSGCVAHGRNCPVCVAVAAAYANEEQP